MNIQKEIIILRKRHNFSREDIASKLGVSVMSIYRWEKNKSSPQSRFILRTIEALKKRKIKS